ncbi:MAG: hypothetical protein ABFC96_02445 [Thermoguttaceae bacterium]
MRRGGFSLPAAWPSGRSRSRAEVRFLLGERRAAERITRRLFGRPLRPSDYAGLAGAPDTAIVEIGASDDRLYIEMRDAGSTTRGYYYVYLAASPILLIDGFRIGTRTMHRHGLGLQMFYRQARNAARLGVTRIEAVAGRRGDENGYYSWPRYGFDAPLPPRFRRSLPDDWQHLRGLLHLMSSERGRQWWRQHGFTLPVAFDLALGSRSRKTLTCYLRQRLMAGELTDANCLNSSAMGYGLELHSMAIPVAHCPDEFDSKP